ncbi:MAG: S8 family peptidase [Lawsonibacter sp.]
MALSPEEYELIQSPDSIDFVIRQSDPLFFYGNNKANIRVAQELSGGYLLCYIHRDDAELLIANLGPSFASSESIVLGPLAGSPLDASGITQIHNQPYLNLKGQNVLVGIIDTGIDYTLPVFLRKDGTSKIQFLYDQTVPGPPPESFVFGTEYTNEQINLALQSPNPYEIVPQRDNSGHGTFIASVAAGSASNGFTGAAPEADLIVVKLDRAKPFYYDRFLITQEQKNAFSSSYVMVGVEYVLQKARRLGRPVSICVALGSNFGGHDGYSIFEEYLSGVAGQKGVCMCVGAGNESLARHHLQGKLTATGETQNVDLRAGENAGDLTVSIWNNIADRLSVSVRSPSGELVGRIPAKTGPSQITKLVLETSTVAVQYFFPLETSGAQLTAVRILNATPGIWTILVHGDIVLDGQFNCWLPLTGFVSPSVEFLSASPYTTITVPGTAINTICCGAYNSFTNSLYMNSSWGPTRTPMMAPDLVSPGENVQGYYPSGSGIMSGTGVATAITTGACALLLQWGVVEGNDVSMSTYQIRAYLIRGCDRSTAMEYPNPQWGYGKLDLLQTFDYMRTL